MFLRLEELSKIDLSKPIIILSRGHYSNTLGKRANGLIEFEFTKDMTNRITKCLSPYTNVFWSTYVDKDPFDVASKKGQNQSLSYRVANGEKIAKYVDSMCKKKKIKVPPILYVAIHANAAGAESASGWEIFVYKKGGKAEELAECIHDSHIKYAGLTKDIKDRGIKEENLYEVRATSMPAVLIEYEFYTNLVAVKKLKSSDWRDKWTTATVQGIATHLGIRITPPQHSTSQTGHKQAVQINTSDAMHETTATKLSTIKADVIIHTTKPSACINGLHSIMGIGKLTKQQMIKYISKNNIKPNLRCSIDAIVDAIIKESKVEGVNHDVVFAQEMLETGIYKFSGQVPWLNNNYCGMKSADGSSWSIFKTPIEGVRAHVQHLQAYATKANLKQSLVDPRYNYVKREFAPYVEWLGAHANPNNYVDCDAKKGLVPGRYPTGWTMPADYGKKILSIIDTVSKL